MSKSKSAKDLAFDRERQKWQSRINALKEEIRHLERDIGAWQTINKAQCEVISDLEKKNEALRELLDVPKEDLDSYIKAELEKAERENKLASLLSFQDFNIFL